LKAEGTLGEEKQQKEEKNRTG